jgi:dethiobiotin synthetase
MKIFISGTNTNIGKTLVSAWLCLHTNYGYFKPVQTGDEIDSDLIAKLSHKTNIYPERYKFTLPRSPHQAANYENEEIDLNKIILPDVKNLIVEGAGGLLVPLNQKHFIIDLITLLNLPIILVTNCLLGTINHTLLSIEAIKHRNLNLLGVISTGQYDKQNLESIEHFGKTKILAHLPFIENINNDELKSQLLSPELQEIFNE